MSECAIGTLLLVERRVAEPHVEDGIPFGDIHPEPQPLIRIFSTNCHHVAACFVGPMLEHVKNGSFANGLPPCGSRESIIHLTPVLAAPAAQATCLDHSHLAAMQKLMVHIEQVFMH